MTGGGKTNTTTTRGLLATTVLGEMTATTRMAAVAILGSIFKNKIVYFFALILVLASSLADQHKCKEESFCCRVGDSRQEGDSGGSCQLGL